MTAGLLADRQTPPFFLCLGTPRRFKIFDSLRPNGSNVGRKPLLGDY